MLPLNNIIICIMLLEKWVRHPWTLLDSTSMWFIIKFNSMHFSLIVHFFYHFILLLTDFQIYDWLLWRYHSFINFVVVYCLQCFIIIWTFFIVHIIQQSWWCIHSMKYKQLCWDERSGKCWLWIREGRKTWMADLVRAIEDWCCH